MNKSTGHELTGRDVQREHLNESVAGAMKPLTGMSPAETALFERRFKLSPAARAECYSLDTDVARAEKAEAAADASRRPEAQQRLFVLRKRIAELRC